ncbi:MAG: peptidylprolyl isomerase [Chloroflexi bacterium]|nr:peptidylprolyl isomerase [Chloroflexota bacterium]
MTNETGKKPVIHKKHVARLEREQQQTRIILYTFFGILAAVILLIGYGWLDVNVLQLNRPAAKVGNTEILVKDLEPRIRLRRQQLINDYIQYQQYAQFGIDMTSQLTNIESQLNNPTLIGSSVLDEMIDEELIRQEAAKRGITVSEEEVTARLESEFSFFPNGTPTPTVTITPFTLPTEPESLLEFITATPEATETPQATATVDTAATATSQPAEGNPTEAPAEATATLEPTATATLVPTATATIGPTPTPFPTATPYTREGFEKNLNDANENLKKLGVSEDYLRNFIELVILREKLQEQITADVKPYEVQLRARHILVADEAAARDIIARLQAGEDFAELARELSTDTGSAVNGGDLGWFGKNAMVPEFEEAAYALENPGDFTTEPVASNFGFHIIQLLAKLERPLSLEDFNTAKDVAFQQWLTSAREEYGVETFDIWQARVPTTPNFITAATEGAIAQKTAQAEQLSTLEAQDEGTETPAP